MEDEDTITEQENPTQTPTVTSKEEAERLAERYISRAQDANDMLNSRYEILESQVQRLILLKIGMIAAVGIIFTALSLSGNLDSLIDLSQLSLSLLYILFVFFLIATIQIAVTTLSLGDRLPIIPGNFIIPLGDPNITRKRNEATRGISNLTADDLLKQADRLSEFPNVHNRLVTEANKIEETQDRIIAAKKRLRLVYRILTIILVLIFAPAIVPFI
jgi:hypothetical protein